MRRILTIIILSVILMLVNINTVFAEAPVVERPDIKIYIDGKLGIYSADPIVNEGRTLLPLREVLVNLGVPNDDSHIVWNSSEGSVTIKKDAIEIYLKVGSKSANVNDIATILDAAPVNYKGRIFIPTRFVAQIFGKKVDWESTTKSVIIGESPDSQIKQVIVSTSEEFIKEIGSNKRILLKSGTYDLSAIKQIDNKDKTLTWIEVDDGKELNLNKISNLTIEGPDTKKAEIRITPRDAEIMNFKNCSNIILKNIKVGHTPDIYTCNAGVLYFDNCANITISNSELYGCGSVGLRARNTKRLNCVDTLIDHCSLAAICLDKSETINFSGCKILNHEAYDSIVYVNNSKDITFEQCEMSDNNYFTDSFFEVIGESDLLIDKCKITNNSQPDTDRDIWGYAYFFKTIDYDGGSLSQIVVKDTEISNNRCDYLYDKKDSVIFENCTIKNNRWKE